MQLIVIACCFLLSAFFSGTESAFTAISAAQIEGFRTGKGRRGRLVYSICQHPQRILSTALIGNNLMNITLTVLASSFTIRYFGDAFLGLIAGILTVTLLLFGEFYPKQIAIINCERWAVVAIYPLYLFVYLFWPLSLLINAATGNLSGKRTVRRLTREHVLNQIIVATRMGVLNKRTTRLLINAVDFEQESVQAVMTHRTEVCSISASTTVDQALKLATEVGYSRFPVYEHEKENIIGILLLKELLAAWSTGRNNKPIRTLITKPHFVGQSRKLGQLLTEMRHHKIQMAIVLDEYGGLAGLVTLEDLLEKVFGELYSEHEEIEQPIVPRGNNFFQINASIPIKEINRELSLSIPNARGRQTLSGYLIHLCGSVPEGHQKITSPFGSFEVLIVTKRRIETVLFRRIDKQPDEMSQA